MKGGEVILRKRFTLDHAYVLTDLAALVLAYWTSVHLRFSARLGPLVYGFINGILGWSRPVDMANAPQHMEYVGEAFRYLVPLALVLHGLYAMRGLYSEHRFLQRRPAFISVVACNFAVLALIVFGLYFRRNVWHPRSFFVTIFVLNVAITLLLRTVARRMVAWVRRRKAVWQTPTILVGETPEARTIDEIIAELRPQGVQIVARMPSPQSGDLTELAHRIKETGARLVIVADESLSVAQVMHILDLTARLDVAAKVLTYKLSVLQAKAGETFDTIRGIPFVHFEEPSASDKNERWRKCLSRLLAALALVALSPVLLVTALLVKLSDRGPVFFIQERFGVDQRPFRMYKFRTMRVDAEALLAKLEAQNEAGGGLFKLKNDPRITRIGRFLRKYSIDELPQIFNVLKGDMRVVGPRPLPRRDLNNYYEEWHYHRHNGRPGLTCLWQVSGRSDIDFENMCILDVYYLRNHTWPMDLRIVLRTVGVVLFGSGAY